MQDPRPSTPQCAHESAPLREAWGKSDEKEGGYHPLAHHAMDVAAVFERLIDQPVIRSRLERAAQRKLRDIDCQRLAAVVFLHDIGKLHPGFQAKAWPAHLQRRPLRGHLQEGWAFLELAVRNPAHPFHGILHELSGWGGALESLVDASFAHHGRTVKPAADPTLRDWGEGSVHYDWRREAEVMAGALRQWFPLAFAPGPEFPTAPRFHHLVTGFVALADWIGSDTRYFRYKAPFDATYSLTAREVAARAVRTIGLDVGDPAAVPAPSFAALTGGWTPNHTQAIVGEIDVEARLVILEAETGSGKTEAALLHFARLFAARKVSGLYFAVPTRAAAAQLQRRVNAAMQAWLGGAAPEVVLAIPGALLSGDFKGQKLPHWQVLWPDQPESKHRWSAEHATRFLAARVAVGTVDQAMLGGLQVKHAHLRGSALSRSLLVVDEVHASDAYMTEVLKRLADEHLAVGGYALLMSATLGAKARAAWREEVLPDAATASATPFPAIWIPGQAAPLTPGVASLAKNVRLDAVPTMDAEQTATWAVAAARRGARVLVVRNTVAKAVETWLAVQQSSADQLLMQVAGGPALHHGRFAAEDRALLDAAVEGVLGREDRPGATGCIVIGTQTLEQSLDIDADLLITDLCPMDVLLQRIGRLHRHGLPRPAGFEEPRAVVLMPETGLDALTVPRFFNGLGGWEAEDGFVGVYRDLAGLELTRRLIEKAPVWRLPDMNRELVEGATHPEHTERLVVEKGETTEIGARWRRYHQQFGGAEAAAEMVARLNVLDRSCDLAKLDFPPSDEHIVTRIGSEGRVLLLESQPVGPFGQTVTRIALPAHWCRGLSVDDVPVVECCDGGLALRLGDAAFHYSRQGLSKSP